MGKRQKKKIFFFVPSSYLMKEQKSDIFLKGLEKGFFVWYIVSGKRKGNEMQKYSHKPEKDIYFVYEYGQKVKITYMAGVLPKREKEGPPVFSSLYWAKNKGLWVLAILLDCPTQWKILQNFGNSAYYRALLGLGVSHLEPPKVKLSFRTYKKERFENSVGRSRSKIREYVLCNEFSYCITINFKPEKQFFSLTSPECKKFLDAFRKACNRRGLKYILVPEVCYGKKNGTEETSRHQIHFHGFISGIPENELFRNENGHLDWTYWRHWGFVCFDSLRGDADREKKLNYILKYLGKDLEGTASEKGAHLYYASKGLKKKNLIYRGIGTFSGKWDRSFGITFFRTEGKRNGKNVIFKEKPVKVVLSRVKWLSCADEILGVFVPYVQRCLPKKKKGGFVYGFN